MNSNFVTLSDEQLEMVVGGDSNNNNQTATATASSTQQATSTNTNVTATNSNVGTISQTAINIATAANFRDSFNTTH